MDAGLRPSAKAPDQPPTPTGYAPLLDSTPLPQTTRPWVRVRAARENDKSPAVQPVRRQTLRDPDAGRRSDCFSGSVCPASGSTSSRSRSSGGMRPGSLAAATKQHTHEFQRQAHVAVPERAVVDVRSPRDTEDFKTRYHESREHRGNGRSTTVATAQTAVKLTYEDYRAAPADNRYELLDGALIMVPAPNTKHQRVSRELSTRLDRFINDQALGELFYAPCDVLLSETVVVQPDLLFVSREREHTITAENVRGAPDLVIEILSPATADKDRGVKREIYGRHGVTEYWLVDPVAETVQIHRQLAGVLVPSVTFGRKQTLRSPLFVRLELRLDDIFSS